MKTESPFTIEELGEIYPTASAYAKENEEFKEAALQATYQLQNGHRGYTALWRHIMDVSLPDLKKNYSNLNVDFDIWMGEADAEPYIPPMLEKLPTMFAWPQLVTALIGGYEGANLVLAGQLMALMGIGVFFYSIVQLTNAIMQAHGHASIPVANMLIAGIARLIIVYLLVGNSF